LGRRANEVDELAGAGAERHAEREDRQQRRDSGAQRRPPVRIADPDEERTRSDDDERDAELGLHHRGKSGDRPGGRPAAASREDQREQERHGPHGIDLSPVRTGAGRLAQAWNVATSDGKPFAGRTRNRRTTPTAMIAAIAMRARRSARSVSSVTASSRSA